MGGLSIAPQPPIKIRRSARHIATGLEVIARHPSTRRSPCANPWLALVLVLCCAVGCVQRRMTIRSNPPGAFVYIDDNQIGTTPCSTDFVYYGTRQFRLVREGYETLTVDKKISAPWYEWYGIDFFSENLVPAEIRDERTIDFDLVPQRLISPEQLVANGEQLRRGINRRRTWRL